MSLLWGHLKTQVTQFRLTARLWEPFKCVKRAFGRVRCRRTVKNAVAVTKKYRNFGSFLGVQEQKAKQQSNASRGKGERKLGRNKFKPNIHFQDYTFFQKEVWFLSLSMKKMISTLQKPKKNGNHVRYFPSWEKKMKANRKCGPIRCFRCWSPN